MSQLVNVYGLLTASRSSIQTMAVAQADPAVAFQPIATEINFSTPLAWCGNGSDNLSPHQFLSDVDQRRRRCHWTDRQTLDFVGVSLKGTALDWFRSSPQLASKPADIAAFAGEGPHAWTKFNVLFLRTFLVGGKTHRIDQRATFKQNSGESVLAYKSRCLESYQVLRSEAQEALQDALAINIDFAEENWQDALASATLDAAGFTHEIPNGVNEDDFLVEPADNAVRQTIRNEQIDTITRYLGNKIAVMQRETIASINKHMVVEFATHLLVDGLHHADVRKFAMDQVAKGADDVNLLWDLVHKHQDVNHPPKSSTAPPSSGYCPPSAAAAALAGRQGQPGKPRHDFPRTAGATCRYCKKRNHTTEQCEKRKRAEAFKAKNGLTGGRGAAASIGPQPNQQPLLPTPPGHTGYQQHPPTAPPPAHQPHHYHQQQQPYAAPHPPPSVSHYTHPQPPQMVQHYPQQHVYDPARQDGHASILNVAQPTVPASANQAAFAASPFAPMAPSFHQGNENAWC